MRTCGCTPKLFNSYANAPLNFPDGSVENNLPANMQVQSLGQGDPLQKEKAAHSSILAWKIPWTEEPGKLQSMGLQSQT